MILVIFLIFGCYNSILKNTSKFNSGDISSGIQVTNELITSLGLEDPFRDILKVVSLPISLVAGVARELEQKIFDKINEEDKMDRELLEAIIKKKDGKVLEILEESSK